MSKIDNLIKKQAELEALIAKAKKDERRKGQIANLIARIDGALDLDDATITMAITAAVNRGNGHTAKPTQSAPTPTTTGVL